MFEVISGHHEFSDVFLEQFPKHPNISWEKMFGPPKTYLKASPEAPKLKKYMAGCLGFLHNSWFPAIGCVNRPKG